ncbi:hypothetical protein HK101_006066 [Irineochytrium annulatum]|nr:hypothetical protein HK101_006066 [Irineochytrium annulatum]
MDSPTKRIALVFSQSEAVGRCRGIKEAKIRAQRNVNKYWNEESLIRAIQLEEQSDDLRRQLEDGQKLEERDVAAAGDTEVAVLRKNQLSNLVDKLGAMKKLLQFQEQQRDIQLSFMANVRHKRVAFSERLSTLEKRQAAERDELMMAQERLQKTVDQIRAIEVKAIKSDRERERRKAEHKTLAEQSKMRNQKQFEHLREIQLCTTRHLVQTNELEISNSEEMMDLNTLQAEEEFNVTLKHTEEQNEVSNDTQRQRRQVEALRALDRQKQMQSQIARNVKKQERATAKLQKTAVKTREKLLLAENPIIIGERGDDEDDMYDIDDASSATGTRSSCASSSYALSSASSVKDMFGGEDMAGEQNGERVKRGFPGRDMFPGAVDNDEAEASLIDEEVRINSEKNKMILLSDEDRELQAIIELGRQRLEGLRAHHAKVLKDLLAQHMRDAAVKQREHRAKVSELQKEQEEELQAIKADQVLVMEELESHQRASQEGLDGEDAARRVGIIGNLPKHVKEDLEAGVDPLPRDFKNVTVFFTDIADFNRLALKCDPSAIITLLEMMRTRFERIVSAYGDLHLVDSFSSVLCVAGGLSDENVADDDKSGDDVPVVPVGRSLSRARSDRVAASAAKCLLAILDDFADIDLDALGLGDVGLELRGGLHIGRAVDGLIEGGHSGSARYAVYGEAMWKAKALCESSKPSCVQVSAAAQAVLGEVVGLSFEERGEVEFAERETMMTHWLEHEAPEDARKAKTKRGTSNFDIAHSEFMMDDVRSKLVAIEKSLSDFLELHPNVPWPDILSQFNSLISKYGSIVQELQQHHFRRALAYPESVSAARPDLVPILLRTKLIPEIEEAEWAAMAKYASGGGAAAVAAVAGAGGVGGGVGGMGAFLNGVNRLDEGAMERELRSWEVKADVHQKIASESIRRAESLRDDFFPAGERLAPWGGAETDASKSTERLHAVLNRIKK